MVTITMWTLTMIKLGLTLSECPNRNVQHGMVLRLDLDTTTPTSTKKETHPSCGSLGPVLGLALRKL